MFSHLFLHRALSAVVLVPALLLLPACGSVGGGRKASSNSYEQLMTSADAHVKAGRFEAALNTLDQAAKADPSRKDPWVRSAQLYFDTGNFSRAIVSAEEALQRDPRDVTADSVLTVSGFRVASQSLQRLQNNGGLRSEAARNEAQQLAATMRSMLGETRPRPARPVADEPPRPKSKPEPKPKPKPEPKDNTSSDPFDKLGGGR
jgi:tetratricopeptide (TPR) repeat protein